MARRCRGHRTASLDSPLPPATPSRVLCATSNAGAHDARYLLLVPTTNYMEKHKKMESFPTIVEEELGKMRLSNAEAHVVGYLTTYIEQHKEMGSFSTMENV